LELGGHEKLEMYQWVLLIWLNLYGCLQIPDNTPAAIQHALKK